MSKRERPITHKTDAEQCLRDAEKSLRSFLLVAVPSDPESLDARLHDARGRRLEGAVEFWQQQLALYPR